MTKPILELKNVTTVVNRGTASQTTILKGINLTINPGDFITIVGTNGAGKSTLFNVVGGNLTADGGQLLHNGQDITHLSQEGRTKFLARVFQDPKLGTAPRMTVAENLLMTATGALSGGQRQALSFLMATLKRPDILLLDEHTAALDPHTSATLMAATDQRIREDKLTALMITHHMEDAIHYGNRLLVLKDGQIKADLTGEDKATLTPEKLAAYFE